MYVNLTNQQIKNRVTHFLVSFCDSTVLYAQPCVGHSRYQLSSSYCVNLATVFDDLLRLVDILSRRRLRSTSSLQLDVSRTHRRTVGDRAFAAAGPTLWNSLPHDITDCVSLTSFCRKLKTFLFSISFPRLHFSV